MQARTPKLAESRWHRVTGWEDVAEGLQQDGGTRSVSRLPGGFPLQVPACDHNQEFRWRMNSPYLRWGSASSLKKLQPS